MGESLPAVYLANTAKSKKSRENSDSKTHDTTKWCCRKKKYNYSRNDTLYATRQKFAEELLGRSY